MEQLTLWQKIVGFEKYSINIMGEVRNDITGRILKTKAYSRYKMATLYKNNRVSKMLLHRLLALTFIPNPNNCPEVNHKDGNKLNNDIDNLEWCTSSQNKYHAYKYGLKTAPHLGKKAELNHLSISVKQVNKAGELVAIWPAMIEAERNGFDSAHISKCCKGLRKTHKKHYWFLV